MKNENILLDGKDVTDALEHDERVISLNSASEIRAKNDLSKVNKNIISARKTLSPEDRTKWSEKLQKLQEKINKAERRLRKA